MVSRYSNELNSFRSGIEDRVSQHKDKIDAVNKALGIKADKVFENAKKISDIGSKLTEGGIGGGVGSTALAKYARKGITKFNTFKQGATDKVKGLADQAESKLQEAGSKAQGLADQAESKVGGLADQAESKVGGLQDAASNAETQVRQTAQNAQDTAETKAQDARDSVVAENETGGARQGVGGDSASGNSLEESVNTSVRVARPGDQILQSKYIGMRKGGLAGEEDEGGTELTENIGEEATTATTEATTESTLTGAAVDLEEDAAATSWLGFLGVPEILAGLGAVAGVAAAGVGIADAVKSGSETAKAEEMPTQAPKAGFQAAGTFVVPTMDSLS